MILRLLASGSTSWPLHLSLGQWSSLFTAVWHISNQPLMSEWIHPNNFTFTPVSMPVVETLKSRYANISGVGGLYNWGNLFLGKSSAMKRKNINQTCWNMKTTLFNWFSVALLWPNLASGICKSLGFSYLTKQLINVTLWGRLGLRKTLDNLNTTTSKSTSGQFI